MNTLLSVEKVQKKFCRSLKRSLFYGVMDIASDAIPVKKPELRLRKDEFLAVDDVSFEVQPGESVALIGGNGAGKSTLLKMINGLFRPDAGKVGLNGKVSALIELGAGFNPILSGRENIYVNASVLGMRRREVDRQLEEIVDFAELGEFIDMPLKSYSSGMKVRLGFAVASQLKPDLLLIDEVLAVGDAAFRAKCHRKLSSLLAEGTAFVLVSHNHHTLLASCTRGVVLKKGKMIANDEIASALQVYENSEEKPGNGKSFKRREKSSNTDLSICDVYFRDSSGHRIDKPKTGHSVSMCLEVRTEKPLSEVGMAVVVREAGHDGRALISIMSDQESITHHLDAGVQELQLSFDALPFRSGTYIAKMSVNAGALNILDAVDSFQFDVDTGMAVGDSSIYCKHGWGVATVDSSINTPLAFK